MIVKKSFDFYDITCDRCDKSLAQVLYEKIGYSPNKVKWDPAFKRDCFYFTRFEDIREAIIRSDRHICKFMLGWRYNKKNNTFVCDECRLILTTKKESKE